MADAPPPPPPESSAMPRRLALCMAALGAAGLSADCGPAAARSAKRSAIDALSLPGAATGAKPRPATYDVRTYGAQGDGSSDDTGAIHAAIAAATKAGGGRVLLPAGTYAITGITLAAGVDLAGEGRDNTILRFTPGSGNAVTVPPVGFNHLCGFQVAFAQKQSSGAAIYLDKVFTITLDGLYVQGGRGGVQFAADGIVLHESTAIFVRDFNIYDCRGDAVRVDGPGGNDAYFSDGIINLGQTASGAGVHLVDFTNGAFNMTDVDILVGEYSLLVENSNYLRFENTYFDSSIRGAVLESGHLMTFANCWFSNRPGPGLHIGGIRGCSVVGGQVVNCGGHGIYVTDGAQYVSLAAVQVIGNNTAGQGSDGIRIDGGAARVSVQGCMVGNDPAVFAGPGQKVGIYIAPDAGTPYALVGSMLFENVQAPLVDHGQGGYVAGNL